MLRVLSSWRKPDKQAADDAALERGAKLGIKDWVLPREKLELGIKCALCPQVNDVAPRVSHARAWIAAQARLWWIWCRLQVQA